MGNRSDPPNRTKINQNSEGNPSSSSPSTHESDPSLMPDLPNELALEILLRLPTKSLGKFKCVAKSWCSLISSREFIKAHLEIASGSPRFMITVSSSDGCRHELHSVNSILNANAEITPTTEVFDIDYPLNYENSLWPVGSCNGLVCMTTWDHELFVCNPVTKVFVKLPQWGINMVVDLKYLGFGYDALNDDYKVVLFWNDGQISVYSVKTNSWHRMENFHVGWAGIGEGRFLQFASGKFYYPIPDGIEDWKIGSFDLANETFETMDRPNKEERQYEYYELREIGGCLSLTYVDYERDCFDIWVMKDSWVKVFSVSHVDQHPETYYISQSICGLRNGEILCLLKSGLFVYDAETNSSRRCQHVGTIGNAILCVESLVSPLYP
ncbi:OLC1v1019150C1 [Oldenlandia corymbosa var. corymbosa]|uniref:OLC1v1019150C1 n=1 Tax=Oldenlandia corymbosa var. corymbosa TaxID=529605 RepID=A0AAV1EDD3_OLDCO|nr:OLC1v1019150C1 [Oldenlandia corymbosa var. corymbosa]